MQAELSSFLVKGAQFTRLFLGEVLCKERPVRTGGDGVSWAVDLLTGLKQRAGKTAREKGKERTFLSPSSGQNL